MTSGGGLQDAMTMNICQIDIDTSGHAPRRRPRSNRSAASPVFDLLEQNTFVLPEREGRSGPGWPLFA